MKLKKTGTTGIAPILTQCKLKKLKLKVKQNENKK